MSNMIRREITMTVEQAKCLIKRMEAGECPVDWNLEEFKRVIAQAEALEKGKANE